MSPATVAERRRVDTALAATQPYVESYNAFAEGPGAEAPSRIQSMRAAAIERFRALGFPTTKLEDWHYTSVGPIVEEKYALLTDASGDVKREELDQFKFGSSDWHTLVFVNGRYDRDLSTPGELPKGVRVMDLQRAWTEMPDVVDQIGQITSYDQHTFTALNTAFMYDGAVVHVERDTVVDRPIHLLFVTDANVAGGIIHPRNLVVVGRNSRASLVESYVALTDAHYFTNAVTEVAVGDGATLSHHKVQREGMRSFHIHSIEAHLARDSHYISFSFATGAALSRTDIHSTLDGEGCGATLNGLYMLDGEQHCDHQTLIVHAQPNCFSRELYKGILDAQSHGVFNGKVYVDSIAQKTDGKQTSKVLLLSERAQIDSKPELVIYADDVKCTHGATVGRLDDQALFYMKSRGLNASTARELLTYAFAADVLETIEIDELRLGLEDFALRRFTRAIPEEV